MSKLIPAFKESLFDTKLSDACTDIAELAIDSFLEEGLLKGIPIFQLFIGVSKTIQNINNLKLLKHTIKFIEAFNEKSISKEKIEKYLKHIDGNEKYAEKELGRVLIILNTNIDLEKSEILARFYRAYIEEEITWEKFCELSDVISRLFLSDIALLFEINNKTITDTSECQSYQADRLISIGLVNSTTKSIKRSKTHSLYTERFLNTTELGKLFCKYADKKVC